MQAAQIEADVEFDKSSYRTDESVGFTFTIRNTGDAAATGLQVSLFILRPTDIQIVGQDAWGPLDQRPGVTLRPGESFTTKVSGQIRDVEEDSVTVRGFVHDATGFGVANFDVNAPVTRVLGRAAGIVFGDANGNGVFDNGEELSGITLTLSYEFRNTFTATSDANGRISFADVPVARYRFGGGEATDGWLFPFVFVQVDESGGSDDLRLRGVRPLNGVLSATMEFTKDEYRPGELARIRITLTNSGSTPLTGIVAGCNRSGMGPQLNGNGPGWAPFNGAGVTVPAGATRTFEVTDTIPDDFINWGYVLVSCDFGYPEVDLLNNPGASDEALVPGGVATVSGVVLGPPFDVPTFVAGVRVVLVQDGPCPIVGEDITGTDGVFEIANVRPGPGYRLFLVPPAGLEIGGNPFDNFQVVGDRPPMTVTAVPGNTPAPTVPTQPATCTTPTTTTTTTTTTPAPQARGTGGLAQTGASVLGLGALGLVTLLLGTGAVLSSRRRRPKAE